MSDVDVLESVLAKDARLIENVSRDQWSATTQCPEYDVKTLLDHIVGWLRYFADGANGRQATEDAGAFTTEDHAAEFRKASDDIVSGWRTHGTDRMMPFGPQEMPASGVLAMTLMEYVTHGLDLALATGQDVPFSDEELETTLERGKATLPDQYRGEGMPFGHVVPVPDDAPAVDRLLGFMGRQPR